MRNSKQRTIIYETIKGCCDHPTADTIYQRVREKLPNVSLGTVYRNLALLVDLGEILSLETSDKKIHYDGDMSYHEHFICQDCKTIYDIRVEPHYPNELYLAGLSPKESKCIYYGTCAKCSQKRAEN